MKQEKIRKMCVTAVFAAIICIFAPISIPVGTFVPISLATLAIYIAAGMLDAKSSVAAVAVYILLGAVGLPVFSGFTGGVQKLLGVTGGYIFGYIPLAIIISLVCGKIHKRFAFPLSMLLGTVVLYFIGTVWFVAETDSAMGAALMTCVVKFIPGDIVKIIAASVLCINLRPRLAKFISEPRGKSENCEENI